MTEHFRIEVPGFYVTPDVDRRAAGGFAANWSDLRAAAERGEVAECEVWASPVGSRDDRLYLSRPGETGPDGWQRIAGTMAGAP